MVASVVILCPGSLLLAADFKEQCLRRASAPGARGLVGMLRPGAVPGSVPRRVVVAVGSARSYEPSQVQAVAIGFSAGGF